MLEHLLTPRTRATEVIYSFLFMTCIIQLNSVGEYEGDLT